MKVLAVADSLFERELIDIAVAPAIELGHEVEIREWQFATVAAQQEQMMVVEQNGPNAVPVPTAFADRYDHDFVVLQFAPLSAAAIANGVNLKAVFVNRAGLENVDLRAVEERSIAIHSTPGRNSRAVAEFTVGMILAEFRNIARSHELLRAGTWTNRFPNSEWTPELVGKTVGMVGYGRVGALVAEMLGGFHCRLQVFDPWLPPDAPSPPRVDLDTLLATSDVVTIHARLTDESRGLVGARELALMKPTSILVNTARAGLVDEGALAAALAAGRIGGAAIDVFATEPPPPDDAVVASDRATVTPHLAGTTRDAFLAGPRMIAEQLRKALA
jgi:D-3-phosphoglycerate dehydrogenase